MDAAMRLTMVRSLLVCNVEFPADIFVIEMISKENT
jgi:hypothetical protein